MKTWEPGPGAAATPSGRNGLRVIFSSLLIIGAVLLRGSAAAGSYHYTVPDRTSDGWQTASLQEAQLDAALLTEMFHRIDDNTYKNLTSVVLVKSGKLVVEEYFPRQEALGEARSRALKRVAPLQLYSATKSVTSLLIGIALDRGLLRDAEQRVSTFFPQYADVFADPGRARLRVRDFLTMSAGLAWDEWTYPYADPRNDALKTLLSPDLLRQILERPLLDAPGTKFNYNTGLSIALGEIIHQASGLRADEFAGRYLFTPLGITDYYWAKLPGDLVETGGGLFLRPRDMAKLGYLFLNHGQWQGHTVVSDAWLKASTRNYVGSPKFPAWLEAADGYGYQWWLGTLKVGARDLAFYGARGRGGQFILVFPDPDLVAVFTGMNDNLLMNQPLDLLKRYVLPAALPPAPRPP